MYYRLLHICTVYLLITATGVCAYTTPFTQEQGTASYDELKLSQHARSSGLAGIQGASHQSPHELNDNPLALTLAKTYFLTATTLFLPKEIDGRYHTIAWGLHTNTVNLALGGAWLDYGTLTGRDDFGNLTSEYPAQSIRLNTTVASDSSLLSWAAQVNYSMFSLESRSSHAFYISGGVKISINNTYHTSLTLSNAGISSSLNKQETQLPLTAILSYGQKFNLLPWLTIHGLIELKKINEEPIHPIAGQELMFYDIATIRCGYNFHEDQSWALGAGLLVGQYRIDYAFKNHTELSGYHSISLGIYLK